MDARRASRRLAVLLLLAGVTLVALWPTGLPKRAGVAVMQRLRGLATIEQRIAEYGPAARARFEPRFRDAGVAYPPNRLVLVGLKAERELEVWADSGESFRRIHTYPLLAASGGAGPKLREGDHQVPEGVYRIESLNPNSSFHLSLRLNYPNDFDRARAADDGRTNLGGDIFIHGKAASVGCLAIGDEAVEELFVIVAETGIARVEVLLCPRDLRQASDIDPLPGFPSWYTDMLVHLRGRLGNVTRVQEDPE